MKRRLFNLAAAVSLMLCAATAAMWIRSYFTGDERSWNSEEVSATSYSRGSVHLVSWRGAFCIGRVSFSQPVSADPGMTYVQVGAGQVMMRRGFFRPSDPLARLGGWSHEGFQSRTGDGSRYIRFVGFALSENWSPSGGIWSVTIPWWFPALGFLIAPGFVWLRTRRRMRVTAEARCPSCGSDLRATPDRCPECGAAPDVRPTTTA